MKIVRHTHTHIYTPNHFHPDNITYVTTNTQYFPEKKENLAMVIHFLFGLILKGPKSRSSVGAVSQIYPWNKAKKRAAAAGYICWLRSMTTTKMMMMMMMFEIDHSITSATNKPYRDYNFSNKRSTALAHAHSLFQQGCADAAFAEAKRVA